MGDGKVWEERFWSRVRKDASCWEWVGRATHHGYGTFDVQFPGMHRECPRQAHRVAWFLVKGEVLPTSVDLCHSCDNRLCVNPDHLFVGTRSDNMQDCADKGRLGATKQANAKARLREAAEDMARVLLALGRKPCPSCERWNDCDECCALDAALRKAWVR